MFLNQLLTKIKTVADTLFVLGEASLVPPYEMMLRSLFANHHSERRR